MNEISPATCQTLLYPFKDILCYRGSVVYCVFILIFMVEKIEAEIINLQNVTQLLRSGAETCTKSSSQQNPISSDSGASALKRNG